MKKFFKKHQRQNPRQKKQVKTVKQTPRFWGLATRLEHRRVSGKKSKK